MCVCVCIKQVRNEYIGVCVCASLWVSVSIATVCFNSFRCRVFVCVCVRECEEYIFRWLNFLFRWKYIKKKSNGNIVSQYLVQSHHFIFFFFCRFWRFTESGIVRAVRAYVAVCVCVFIYFSFFSFGSLLISLRQLCSRRICPKNFCQWRTNQSLQLV